MSDFVLLPCPFCGGVAELLGNRSGEWVACSQCGASTEIMDSDERDVRNVLAERWNAREESRRECPLVSLSAAIAFTPHDWSEDHRMAWIYGIACGWSDEAMAELKKKHCWDDETVERLQRLRRRWKELRPSS